MPPNSSLIRRDFLSRIPATVQSGISTAFDATAHHTTQGLDLGVGQAGAFACRQEARIEDLMQYLGVCERDRPSRRRRAGRHGGRRPPGPLMVGNATLADRTRAHRGLRAFREQRGGLAGGEGDGLCGAHDADPRLLSLGRDRTNDCRSESSEDRAIASRSRQRPPALLAARGKPAVRPAIPAVPQAANPPVGVPCPRAA